MTPQATDSTPAPPCAAADPAEPVSVARLHAARLHAARVAAGFGVLRVADVFLVVGGGGLRWCESPEQLRRCALALGIDLED